MKFYNRVEELKILNNHWQVKDSLAVDVLVGRRRIGKTELALRYAKGKKHLYFFVARKEIPALLEEWADVLREYYSEVTSFKNLDEFLKVLFILAKREKLLIIFDEFQNFRYTYPSAFSDFQKHIDINMRDANSHILFLGSSVSLMEKIFKDKKEPLFGRATRIINLRGFDFLLVANILKDLGYQPDIKFYFDVYSVFGGVPKYYDILEKERKLNQSLQDIIVNQFLDKDAGLKTEGLFLLQSEFGQDYQLYFDILTYIAQGETRLKDIAARLKQGANKIAVYCQRLEKYYGLLEKRLPALDPVKINSRYYIRDSFLKFWFRYIYQRLSYIERGATHILWKYISQDLKNYQGSVFENLLIDLFLEDTIQRKLDLGFNIWDYGKYWDNRGELELDLAAFDKEKKHLLLMECKLNAKRVNLSVIKNLKSKASHKIFKDYADKKLAVFTLTSVDDAVKKMCRREGVLCVSMDEVLRF